MATDKKQPLKSRGNDQFSERAKKAILDSFAAKEENSLLVQAGRLSEQELIDAFPYYPGQDQEKNTRRWLRQELSKWKNTPSDSFSATLQKLYIYYVITGTTPNEVLLQRPYRIEFMDWDSIKLLVEDLRMSSESRFDRIIPVAIDISSVQMVFLHVYPKPSPYGTQKSRTLVWFSVVSWVPMCQGEEDGISIEKVGISGKTDAEVDITKPDYLQEIERRYKRCETKLTDKDDLIRDVQDMYTDLEFWMKHEMEVPLLKWFPVAQAVSNNENLPRRAKSVDELISNSNLRRDQQMR